MNRSERLKNRIADRIQIEGIKGKKLHAAPEQAAVEYYISRLYGNVSL